MACVRVRSDSQWREPRRIFTGFPCQPFRRPNAGTRGRPPSQGAAPRLGRIAHRRNVKATRAPGAPGRDSVTPGSGADHAARLAGGNTAMTSKPAKRQAKEATTRKRAVTAKRPAPRPTLAEIDDVPTGEVEPEITSATRPRRNRTPDVARHGQVDRARRRRSRRELPWSRQRRGDARRLRPPARPG